MKLDRLPESVLLGLGIISLVKAVWTVVRPDSVQRVVVWWVKRDSRILKTMGIVCILLGAVLWVLVLLNQPLVSWLLVAMGLLFLWGGRLYLDPSSMDRMVRVLIGDRSPLFVRILGVGTGILAILIIWVAARSLS